MTPKEKAKDLVEKFKLYSWISCIEGYEELSNIESAKYCALIAVDEILEYIDSNHNGYYTMPESVKIKYDYYEEVKQELEKL